MTINLITPHQPGPRDQFLKKLDRYISRQTVKPDEWFVVDHETGKEKDLTERVRVGLQMAKYADLILIMEDDDWYSPDYIQVMADGWDAADRPKLIGIASTWYYHVGVNKFALLQHPNRSSLMSTGIAGTAVDQIKWPADEYIFLDIDLWRQLGGVAMTQTVPIAVGIKHGIGNTGGIGHRTDWKQYLDDPNRDKLKQLIGTDEREY
jgi:hypothetical protein